MQNTIKLPTIGWGTVLAALLAATSPAGAAVERVPTIDPQTTSCAAYVKEMRHSSIGRFVFAITLRPITANSPVTAEPGDTSLYGDAGGPVIMPVDPKSYATIVKRKLPAWLFLSFDINSAANGALRRSIAYATPEGCRSGDAQYVRVADAPIDLKRELLRALTDLNNGGTGDPRGISQAENTRISQLFLTSVEADLQTAVEALGSTPPKN